MCTKQIIPTEFQLQPMECTHGHIQTEREGEREIADNLALLGDSPPRISIRLMDSDARDS